MSLFNFFKQPNEDINPEATLRKSWDLINAEKFNYIEAKRNLLKLPDEMMKYKAYELYKIYNDGENRDNMIMDSENNAAWDYLNKAVRAGNMQAYYEMGLVFLGEKETHDKGSIYIKMAADMGHLHASRLIDENGENLPSGIELAARGDLYSEESYTESFAVREMYYSAELFNLGVAVRGSMVGDYFNQRNLYDEAVIWFEKAAEMRDENGMYNYLVLHANKDLRTPNNKKAFEYAEKLVLQRDSDAMHSAGRLALRNNMRTLSATYFKLCAHYSSAELGFEAEDHAARLLFHMSIEEQNMVNDRYRHFLHLIDSQ